MSTLRSRPPAGHEEPPTARRRPPLAGFWVAGLVVVGGSVGAVVWAAIGTFAAVTAPDGFDRAPLPTTVAAQVAEPGTLVVYYEGDPVPSLADLDLEVTGPGGDPVPVEPYLAELRYDSPAEPGAVGEAVATVAADTPGRYTIASTYDPAGTGTLAVGEDVARDFVAHLAGPMLLALGALLVATVLAVTTAVRRTRR